MPAMTREQIEKFLKRNNLLLHVAYVKPDGSPYVHASWYEYDGKHIYLVSRLRSNHVEYVKKNSKVAAYLDLVEEPFTRVLVEGRAEIVAEGPLGDISDAASMARRMAKKYLGPDGPKYLEPTMPYPRAWVKIKPEKVHGWERFDWPAFHKK